MPVGLSLIFVSMSPGNFLLLALVFYKPNAFVSVNPLASKHGFVRAKSYRSNRPGADDTKGFQDAFFKESRIQIEHPPHVPSDIVEGGCPWFFYFLGEIGRCRRPSGSIRPAQQVLGPFYRKETKNSDADRGCQTGDGGRKGYHKVKVGHQGSQFVDVLFEVDIIPSVDFDPVTAFGLGPILGAFNVHQVDEVDPGDRQDGGETLDR